MLIRPLRIDGLPGTLSRERDGILQTTAFDIRDGRIAAITHNPDKLARLVEEVGCEGAIFCKKVNHNNQSMLASFTTYIY